MGNQALLPRKSNETTSLHSVRNFGLGVGAGLLHDVSSAAVACCSVRARLGARGAA